MPLRGKRMKKKRRQHNPEDLRRIKALRLIDDDFMNICFDGYIEGAELLLKVILDRDDLKVTEVKTQKQLNNLNGRSVWLDICATDSSGAKYDIEIQRANKGANPKRARYHSSMVDADVLKEGEDFTDLRENYVIFITEKDVIGTNKPIYHIDRVILEDNVQFNDGEHIIYVNGSLRAKNTALGKLMSDFFCTEAKDMHYKELSERVRQYKETEKGVDTMCDIWDEVRNEGIEKHKIETAQKMIKDGELPLEKIAEYSGLSLDKVRKLAGNMSA